MLLVLLFLNQYNRILCEVERIDHNEFIRCATSSPTDDGFVRKQINSGQRADSERGGEFCLR